MISTTDAFQILFFLGSVVGVWVRSEIKLAILTERIKGNEEKRREERTNNSEVFAEIKQTMAAIFVKISHIEEKLNQKVDRHEHGNK
jgi:nitrous oxidase accessory protein NosD